MRATDGAKPMQTGTIEELINRAVRAGLGVVLDG